MRGRPKMAPEDLSVTYRLKLEGEDRVKARILAGMTKAKAKETEREENREKRNAEKKREKDAVELRRHGGKGLRGAARHTTREEDERQFRGTLRPRKQGLPAAGRGKKAKKGRGLSKRTRAACKAGDEREEVRGEGEGDPSGECTVHGCTGAATHPAQVATTGEKHQRWDIQ